MDTSCSNMPPEQWASPLSRPLTRSAQKTAPDPIGAGKIVLVPQTRSGKVKITCGWPKPIGLRTRLYLHPCDHKNPVFMDVANTKVVGSIFRFLQSSGFHQISLHVCPFMTKQTGNRRHLFFGNCSWKDWIENMNYNDLQRFPSKVQCLKVISYFDIFWPFLVCGSVRFLT